MSEAAQAVQRAVDEMKENGEKKMEKKTRARKANGAARTNGAAKKAKAPKAAKKARVAKAEPDGFINVNIGKGLREKVVKRKEKDAITINQVVISALEAYL